MYTGYLDPRAASHSNAACEMKYKSIEFLPKKAPLDMMANDQHSLQPIRALLQKHGMCRPQPSARGPLKHASVLPVELLAGISLAAHGQHSLHPMRALLKKRRMCRPQVSARGLLIHANTLPTNCWCTEHWPSRTCIQCSVAVT